MFDVGVMTLYQMRHLFLVVDMSRCMAEKDLKPDRITCTVKVRSAGAGCGPD